MALKKYADKNAPAPPSGAKGSIPKGMPVDLKKSSEGSAGKAHNGSSGN